MPNPVHLNTLVLATYLSVVYVVKPLRLQRYDFFLTYARFSANFFLFCLHLVIISVFQRSFWRIYLLSVLRLQWRLLAMLRLERPDCNALRIYSSFPYKGLISFLVRLPFGRPMCFPSALSLAKASRVRWLMRLRSISADKPKANANTLDCMSSPNR